MDAPYSIPIQFFILWTTSLLGSQAYLNCWASGIDDAGWELVAQGTNSKESPGLLFPLTSDGPDLQVTKVEFDDELVPNSKATGSIQIYNSGSALRMHSM